MTRLSLSRRSLLAGWSAAALLQPHLSLAQGVPSSSAPVPPAGSPPVKAVQPAYWSWFRYSPSILSRWTITANEESPDVVVAKPIRLGLATAVKRILVIYPRPSSAYDVAITKIMNVFEDKALDADITIVNFHNDDARGRRLLAMAEAERFDLILSMGSETTAWLWGIYKGGKIPVVSVCSKDPVVLGQLPDYNVGSGTNFAFTSLNMPIEVQMAYVHELKPNLRNIAVLVDSRNVSAIETQSKPVIDFAKARNIRVLELAVQNPANARAELEKLVSAAVLQMSRNDPDLSNSVFWVTGSTSVFREIATINEHSSRAAVLSVVPEIVQGGADSAVLSIGISFESNAHMAAVYAADILKGRARVSALKAGVVSPPDIAVSFRKARDIGMHVPFSFFEAASTIFDYEGNPVRVDGASVVKKTI